MTLEQNKLHDYTSNAINKTHWSYILSVPVILDEKNYNIALTVGEVFSCHNENGKDMY